jgi:hypothetical protein
MTILKNNELKLWLYNYFAPYIRRDNRLPLKGESLISVEFNQQLMALKIEGKLNGLFFHIAHETGDGNKTAFGYALKMMGKFNGIADYIFINGNDVLFIEVKYGKNKLSEHQKLFQKWCEFETIPYHAINNVEDGLQLLIAYGFLETNEPSQLDKKAKNFQEYQQSLKKVTSE